MGPVLGELMIVRKPDTRLVVVPVPAVGAEWSYTLPEQVRVVAIFEQFVADAVVANRVLTVQVKDPAGNDTARFGCNQNTVATQSVHCTFMQMGATSGTPGAQYAPMPEMTWPKGTTFNSVTIGKDPGDKYTSVTFVVEDLPRYADR